MTDKLRIASYNIRKAVGLDYRRDPMRVLKIINGLDADVVAVQEVDKRLGDRPGVFDRRRVEEESDFVIADLAQNEVSLGWHGNAVLVRRGLTIHEVGHITLPGLEPRGAVRVDISRDDVHLAIVGTHLGLLRPYRRRQLETIRAHLEMHETTRTMIVGDFNEWSDGVGLEPIDGDYDVVSPGLSFHASRPMASLDKIALGEGLKLIDAGVEDGDNARVASDHLPVWADVSLEPNGG
jgi:endonuclease/exonuclease/phosphatase family metal-dependent hydrolase